MAAPAGAGKSALLSEWDGRRAARARPRWLSLDPGGRRPPPILARRARGAAARRAARARDRPRESADGDADLILPALAELARGPRTSRSSSCSRICTRSATRSGAARTSTGCSAIPSPALRLVISTRVRTRRCVSGGCSVTGRATPRSAAATSPSRSTETAELLGGVRHRGDPATAETPLWQRTEGWAAGLRLAALTMRAHPDPAAFVARLRGRRQPRWPTTCSPRSLPSRRPTMREYLLPHLRSSTRTTADLADALTGRTDSAPHSHTRLARDHALALVVGATTAPGTAFHPLFAELLRSRAASPGRRRSRRAAPARRPLVRRRGRAVAGATSMRRPAVDWEHARALAADHWVPMLLERRARRARSRSWSSCRTSSAGTGSRGDARDRGRARERRRRARRAALVRARATPVRDDVPGPTGASAFDLAAGRSSGSCAGACAATSTPRCTAARRRCSSATAAYAETHRGARRPAARWR